MARCLRAKKRALKWKKKEMQRIKRVNQLNIGLIKCMDELVEEFLVTAESENDNNDLETANIWTDEAIRGMNDLNLNGTNNITAPVDQVQPYCNNSSNGSAAVGDNDGYDEDGEGGNSGGCGGGHGGERH
ncbi:hypothetical protein COLO4_22230 [Corchorus olitorius]|uniref:Uncharacterized protein n=1 Tax=Corchorus olitorius TaxID=93759 RepID=A0A1R3INF9_9ROSI|nr:hypothetical protein COLO4_22230 [Corchorus olitorius]